MDGFMIRFLVSNLFLCGAFGAFFLIRKILERHLTSRMQYRLWYVMAGLMAVPFLPLPVTGFSGSLSWTFWLGEMTSSGTELFSGKAVRSAVSGGTETLYDFALSVSRAAPSGIGTLLAVLWLTGILAAVLLLIRSRRRFCTIERSALPLQNEEACALYQYCLNKSGITAHIPVYSTAFLKSPMIAGLFRPRIYLPIHAVSDCSASELQYMMLHELQHYRRKDPWTGCLMDLAGILYWFNPLVWYALGEMRGDREAACDAGVLDLLSESEYEEYGRTLIRFAEKLSLPLFPFAAGISSTMRQMQKRIIRIASYRKLSPSEKAKGSLFFCMAAVILTGFAPMLSAHAADRDRYRWDASSEHISVIDLSSHFNGADGCFVLYNQKEDAWVLYNMEHALSRTPPDSTYKIYDALFGLEEGVIAPGDSFRAWDGTACPFEAWNADQDLYSAMQFSVNWYFQDIDAQLGADALKCCLEKIGYGNEKICEDLSSYWMQSSLKISPVEQVELLRDLYNGRFDFASENVEAVKNSICLFSSGPQRFYGKTGTGRVEGMDTSGWFVGFLETGSAPCFFAVHIRSDADAAGSRAAEIAMSVLADLGLWTQDLAGR